MIVRSERNRTNRFSGRREFLLRIGEDALGAYTNMKTEQTVAELLNTYLLSAGIAPALLENPANKLSDLGLDSLGVAEMLFEVEDRFGISVDDPMAMKEMTVAEACAFFESRIAAMKQAADSKTEQAEIDALGGAHAAA